MTAKGWRWSLLVGLSFFLGLAFSQLYAVSNSLFLLQYGSAALPVVYVAIAVVVPVFSYAFARMQKRWQFPTVALVTMTFFTGMFLVAWLGLRVLGAQWLSFSLVVGFTLGGLLCGIVRGALAGFLFDARKLKQMYPLILAGEILGVVLGGLSIDGARAAARPGRERASSSPGRRCSSSSCSSDERLPRSATPSCSRGIGRGPGARASRRPAW